MRKIVHLSDLHFGRTDEKVIAPLITLVRALKPDVVVVSGDLTQRARASQFKEARTFLSALPEVQVVVPGNHDVPLFNLLARFFWPLRSYKKIITSDLEQTFVDDEIAVLGLSTARSFVFKNGRINHKQVAHVHRKFAALPKKLIKIVVTHHPFDLGEKFEDEELVGRAGMAMKAFAGLGVDLLLAGHVHKSHSGNTAERYRFGDFSAVAVQAGTATSTRRRGETNAFNVIHVGSRTIRVEQYAWRPKLKTFVVAKTSRFSRISDRWEPAGKKR